MTFGSNSVTLDFSQPAINQQIVPCSPVLSSQGLGWQNIHVQHHHQPTWQTPVCCHNQHTIVVHPITPLARIERRLNEQRRDEQVMSGDIVLAPANVQHQVAWSQAIDYIVLALEPSYLTQVAFENVNAERVELIPHFATSDQLIYQLGLALQRELEAGEQSSRLYVEAATQMLAVHLLRHYCVDKQRLRSDVGGLSQNQLNEAIDYIHHHLSQGISVAAIAATLRMSQYHFTRLFKQSIGLTPYQYIIQLRVEEAKRLLLVPNLSITQISQQLGFSSPSQFAHFFRKYAGLSPKKYRQSR